jgi:hypothetical protein
MHAPAPELNSKTHSDMPIISNVAPEAGHSTAEDRLFRELTCPELAGQALLRGSPRRLYQNIARGRGVRDRRGVAAILRRKFGAVV